MKGFFGLRPSNVHQLLLPFLPSSSALLLIDIYTHHLCTHCYNLIGAQATSGTQGEHLFLAFIQHTKGHSASTMSTMMVRAHTKVIPVVSEMNLTTIEQEN